MPRREEGLVAADDHQRQLGSRPELGEAAAGPPQGEQVGKGVELGHDEQQEVVEEVEEARFSVWERGRQQVRGEFRRSSAAVVGAAALPFSLALAVRKKRKRRRGRGRRGSKRWRRRRGLDLCPVLSWCLHLDPKLSLSSEGLDYQCSSQSGHRVIAISRKVARNVVLLRLDEPLFFSDDIWSSVHSLSLFFSLVDKRSSFFYYPLREKLGVPFALRPFQNCRIAVADLRNIS